MQYGCSDSLSEMQIKDVKNLFSTIPQLDQEYLSEWVEKLNLESIYNKVCTNE